MANENKVQLLWNCTTALEANSHTNKLLKSYYMNMCRKLAKTTLQIPKEKFSSSQMCSHCGCFWSESEFSLKLKPQQVIQKSKTKKLIDQLHKSIETGERGLISGKQRKRAKWLQKKIDNYMQIKCDQCKHKSLIKMEKPKRRHKKLEAEVEPLQPEEEIVVPVKAKKKKRTKNKTAGLKLPVTTNEQERKHPQNNKTTSAQTRTELPKTSAAVGKSKKPLNKSKKNQSTSLAIGTASKMVSKTQQQNSLLQLAALLKQQTTASSGDGKSSTQKRLESLLK